MKKLLIAAITSAVFTTAFAQQELQGFQDRKLVILNFAQEYAEKTALDADTISTKKYSPNVLWSTLEVQGHNQLGLGKWVPGVNDLTGEQISMIDFEKIDFSEFYRQFPEVN